MKKAIDFLNDFEKNELEHKSKNTVSAYISDIKQFNNYLVNIDIELDDITNEDTKAYIEHISTTANIKTGKILKAKSINRKIVSVKRFVDYLNNHADYENKIFVELRCIRVQEQYYLEDLLEFGEYNRMLNRALSENDYRAYMIFNTLYYTGARVSEFLQIKPIHIKKDNLTVRGKKDKIREIILSDAIVELLNEYIKKNDIAVDQPIFKMTRQTVHDIIKEYAGKCRIKLTKAHAHNFRHLCAIRLLESGATIEEVADFLGHTNINTTRIYIKKTKKELRKTINRL